MAALLEFVTPSEVVPQGPFGGSGGAPFYDGVGDVVQITITYSSKVVWSVQANYRQKTDDVFSAAQHGSKGPQVKEIKLDYSHGERLLRVKGTTDYAEDVGSDVVTSLTFITTTNHYGPFGAEVGRPFQSSPEGQVVGFFGRAGGYLDSLGTFTDFFHFHPNVKPEGPWGGNGGEAFYYPPADKIRKIVVEYSDFIISLDVTYDRGSQGFVTAKHGGLGSWKGDKKLIAFDEDEYLTQVTGTTGSVYDQYTLVTSLTFITNKNDYGPYGKESGDRFETYSSASHAHILGFFGRSGWAIDQLGAFVGGVPSPPVVEIERFGGNGGIAFYEGRGDKVSQIEVTYVKGEGVTRLQVTYLQGFQQFVGALHGTGKGDDSAKISLNSPDEYLVQVTGTHGRVFGYDDLIVSIAFITNKKKYGPYGNPDSGTSFASSDDGQILGLFGRASLFLDQIGVISFPIKRAGNRLPVAA